MLKNTKTRTKISELLDSATTPMSAYEIYEKLKSEKITLSSIYRTLDTFYNNNIVTKETTPEGVNIYSKVLTEHKHFLECKKCHKQIPLDYCPYHKVNAKIKSNNDFVVDEHNVVIYGTCKDCVHNTEKK